MIYLHRYGKQEGPYSIENLRAYLADGRVAELDLAWRNQTEGWIPLGSLLSKPYEYRCAHCGSTVQPAVFRRISSGGWIFFFLMLLFCLPLALFGFLMKEEYSVCPTCGTRQVL